MSGEQRLMEERKMRASEEVYGTIFALLRQALFCGVASLPEKVCWEEVFSELVLQTVETLPVEILPGNGELSGELSARWEQNTFKRLQRWYRLLEEQQRLVGLFEAASIPFAVVKGFAADCYYPKPEYRAMGDIDLIVRPKDYARALELMVSNGYLAGETGNNRHGELRKNGVEFELHWRFSIPPASMEERPLDVMIYEGILRTDTCRIGEYHFPVLPRLTNGLVLLQHISQHLEGGLGLRQIIDWMLYVHRELTDEYWENEFQGAARAVGLEKLAVTVTRMCQMYLGLPNELSWCRGVDTSLCEELMELIIDKGNFGRRDHDSNTAIWVINGMRNPVYFMRLLQQRGRTHWRAAQRYPVLRPFAWMYQIGRYARRGLRRPDPLRTLWTDMALSKRECALLDELGAERRGRGM